MFFKEGTQRWEFDLILRGPGNRYSLLFLCFSKRKTTITVTAPQVYRGLLTKAFPQQLVMEACAEEMSSADLSDQKSAGRWLGIKRSIKSTMKTWQVDITANHLFPQKKEGVFGGNRCKTPTGVRQMLSVGKILFEPTSLKWWWGAIIYQIQ